VPHSTTDPFFTHFDQSIEGIELPQRFTYPFDYEPHPLCLLAAEQLQHHLYTQTEWDHNFGLIPDKEGKIIGKMFGVMVVRNAQNEIGYLSAFSGKLADGNNHAKFVPAVFDALTEGSFLNKGMLELNKFGAAIKALEEEDKPENEAPISALKKQRKDFSTALQEQLFDHYHFLNQAGESKDLRTIFHKNTNSQPPSGAGECAAPKLLQYAFKNNLQPLAMAEFWWGLSRRSYFWEHKEFYPACQEKCAPILEHMLKGMELDENPR